VAQSKALTKVLQAAWEGATWTLVVRLVVYNGKVRQEVAREDVKAIQSKKKEEKVLEMTMTHTTKQKYEDVCSCHKAQTTSNNQQYLQPTYLVVGGSRWVW
jgi:hypothetical protein